MRVYPRCPTPTAKIDGCCCVIPRAQHGGRPPSAFASFAFALAYPSRREPLAMALRRSSEGIAVTCPSKDCRLETISRLPRRRGSPVPLSTSAAVGKFAAARASRQLTLAVAVSRDGNRPTPAGQRLARGASARPLRTVRPARARRVAPSAHTGSSTPSRRPRSSQPGLLGKAGQCIRAVRSMASKPTAALMAAEPPRSTPSTSGPRASASPSARSP